jgi:serine/threonine protein phosphatase PrpC
MQHHVHLRTDVGKERERNEDHAHTFQREDGVWILIVCDGMGGHDGGEIASHVAVETLTECLLSADNNDPAQAIEDALRAANTAVVNAASPQGGLDMGTTAVVAWVEAERFWFGWVGDSRLFHWRGDQKLNGSIDHTRIQVMVDLGLLSPSQVRGHPDSHILMQALGGGPAAQQSFLPSVIREAIPLLKGDFLLLCSDGLHDLVINGDIYWITILDASMAGSESPPTDRTMAGWYAIYPEPEIPVLGDMEWEARDWFNPAGWPTMMYVDENMVVQVYDKQDYTQAFQAAIDGAAQ